MNIMTRKDINISNEVTISGSKSRTPLVEGRSRGVAYSFLKRLDGNEFECITPFSCCKDYLNDVLYLEVYPDREIQLYGLTLSKSSEVLQDDYLYLGISYLNSKSKESDLNDSPVYPMLGFKTLQEEKDFLFNNLGALIDYINHFEDYLCVIVNKGVEPNKTDDTLIREKTRLLHVKDSSDKFVLRLSKYWGESTSAISLYTAIVRMFMSNASLKSDFWDCLKSHIDKSTIEKSIATSIVKILQASDDKIKKLFECNLKTPEMQAGAYNVHNSGIVKYAGTI
jgi:hypothetical protein